MPEAVDELRALFLIYREHIPMILDELHSWPLPEIAMLPPDQNATSDPFRPSADAFTRDVLQWLRTYHLLTLDRVLSDIGEALWFWKSWTPVGEASRDVMPWAFRITSTVGRNALPDTLSATVQLVGIDLARDPWPKIKAQAERAFSEELELERQRLLADAEQKGLTTYRANPNEETHMLWLIQHQVMSYEIGKIAERACADGIGLYLMGECRSAPAIRRAIKAIALVLGLTLEKHKPGPKPK